MLAAESAEKAKVAHVKRIRISALGLRHFRAIAPLLIIILTCFPLFAQTSSLADRLPADTIFFARWRGMNSLTAAEKTNHVMQLFDDPDFHLGRDALIKSFRDSLAKNGAKTEPATADILSILDNSAVAGFVLNPASRSKPTSDAPVPPVGFFMVYDATGKTAVVKKLRADLRANGKEVPTVMTYEFNGTTVEARTAGTDVSYTALTPKFYFLADQKSVIEDLITRFSSEAMPATSVTQLPEYHAIQKLVAPDATIEFFARVPDLSKTLSSEQLAKPSAKFAENLHLNQVHVFGGSVSFAGQAARFRGAILGDASEGSLFDIAGPSSATFATLPVVSAGPIFSISRFNLVALYRLLRAAATPELTAQQTAALGTYEAMAQGFLGMPITDALQLFTGEFGSRTTITDDGTSLQSYAISIQKPQDLLRILRAVGSSWIAAENTVGDTTFLDLSYPYTDPVTMQKRRESYYLAVTPTMLFAAPRKAAVRAAMALPSTKDAAPTPSGLLASADALKPRSLLPENLSGLSAADLTQIPWDKVMAHYWQQLATAAKNATPPGNPPPDWMKSVNPEVLTRHLRFSISGWWKDSSGIYFDSYLQ
jgi:hypothetical protein